MFMINVLKSTRNLRRCMAYCLWLWPSNCAIHSMQLLAIGNTDAVGGLAGLASPPKLNFENMPAKKLNFENSFLRIQHFQPNPPPSPLPKNRFLAPQIRLCSALIGC